MFTTYTRITAPFRSVLVAAARIVGPAWAALACGTAPDAVAGDSSALESDDGLECLQSSECPAEAPICCVHATYPPLLGSPSASASCAATCKGAGSPGPWLAHLETQACTTAADCAGYTGHFDDGVERPWNRCCKLRHVSAPRVCLNTFEMSHLFLDCPW